MAAVFDESPLLLLTGEEWADAALSALTAAGFEVRWVVDREAIEAALDESLRMCAILRVCPNKRDLADAVLAVLNEGQEP